MSIERFDFLTLVRGTGVKRPEHLEIKIKKMFFSFIVRRPGAVFSKLVPVYFSVLMPHTCVEIKLYLVKILNKLCLIRNAELWS